MARNTSNESPITDVRAMDLMAWIRSSLLLVGWALALTWVVDAGGKIDGHLDAHIERATAQQLAYQTDGVIKTAALVTVEFLALFLYLRPHRADPLRKKRTVRALAALAAWLGIQLPMGMHAPSLFYCHFGINFLLLLGLSIATMIAHVEWRK